MKIGIDISQIVYRGTGVARFTRGLTEAILQYDADNQWIFFFFSLRQKLEGEIEEKIKSKGFRLIKYRLPPSLLSFLWNNLHLVNVDHLAGRLDWFISSDWTEPPSTTKKATVVHDMVFLRYPETVAKKIRQTQEKRLKWVKKEAKIIFADSQTTKNDLMNFFDIEGKRVIVNYPGVSVVKPSKTDISSTLNKYKLKKPFILTVGKIEPRKNLSRLIEAFRQLAPKTIDLVVVGPKGWDTSINRLIEAKNVRFLNYVADKELYALYSSCLFFIYPSIWEGFGYPLVEAMKLGAPTATSNTSSLKEIGNEAALLFDPFDIKSIKKALERMIKDAKFRQKLTILGKRKAKEFTWKRYYNAMIKALRQNLT